MSDVISQSFINACISYMARPDTKEKIKIGVVEPLTKELIDTCKSYYTFIIVLLVILIILSLMCFNYLSQILKLISK